MMMLINNGVGPKYTKAYLAMLIEVKIGKRNIIKIMPWIRRNYVKLLYFNAVTYICPSLINK